MSLHPVLLTKLNAALQPTPAQTFTLRDATLLWLVPSLRPWTLPVRAFLDRTTIGSLWAVTLKRPLPGLLGIFPECLGNFPELAGKFPDLFFRRELKYRPLSDNIRAPSHPPTFPRGAWGRD